MTDDDGKKTRRLDDEYFREIAKQAKTQKLDSDKTQILGREVAASDRDSGSTGFADIDGNRTRVFQPREGVSSDTRSVHSAMDDPPTGWLVAVEGPGKGTVMTLGMGLNSIGRGPEPRVSIPFEDDSISRGKCFVVVYDSVNRVFFVTPGEGKTLTYIGTSPILEKTELVSGIELKVGDSKFRFVAFCGVEFDW
jgi:hypothetical protein